MRKSVVTILIFLFTATAVYCESTYENRLSNGSESNGTEEYSGNSITTTTNSVENSDSGGLFRSEEGPGSPGGRPQIKDGIGEEAPVGDGLPVLLLGCILLGTVKIYKKERLQKPS